MLLPRLTFAATVLYLSHSTSSARTIPFDPRRIFQRQTLPSNSSPTESNFTLQVIPNATRYDHFKNTRFSPICPLTTISYSSKRGRNIEGILISWAKSQEEFCSHLDPSIPWVVLPTRATSAAYLPNWSTASAELIIPSLSLAWLFFHKEKQGFTRVFDFGTVLALLWSVGQVIYWTYETKRAVNNPRKPVGLILSYGL